MNTTKHKIWLILALLALTIGNTFAQSLSFEVRNETQQGNTYAFDLFMKADQADTWHSRGQIYLNYDTEAFGQAIVANGQVSVTSLELLTETSPIGAKYQTVNVADNGNRLAITWQSNFLGLAPSGATHTAVPLTPSPLYHVEIEMKEVTQQPRISFNIDLMKGQQFMLLGARQEIPYGQSLALPTRLLAFSATPANSHDVQLTWETTHAFNSDHFVIEKQKNNGTFEALTQVEAQGRNQEVNAYTYLDQSGMGNQNYYRIKQVDRDGTFRYSQVERVDIEAVKNDRFVVFPSPATTQISLKATHTQLDADYTFTISDVSGNILFQGRLMKNRAPETQINISNYAAGTYYVRTQSPEGKVYLNRFTKVNK